MVLKGGSSHLSQQWQQMSYLQEEKELLAGSEVTVMLQPLIVSLLAGSEVIVEREEEVAGVLQPLILGVLSFSQPFVP